MIKFIEGDLFDLPVEGIGHGVNCQGVMGSGIAPFFKRMSQEMYVEYRLLCNRGSLRPGHVYPFYNHQTRQWLYNIASQDNPGPDAKYSWLKQGLRATRLHAEINDVDSVALPRIGAGIGGLEWELVRIHMDDVLSPSPVKFTIVSLPGADD